MQEPMTFKRLCQELRRGPTYIRRLQLDLGLHIPGKPACYSQPQLNFLSKVVALRTFNVPVSDIVGLFNKEKKILELLHFDSIDDSPTWYLDACDGQGFSPSRLLLTGADLGFRLDARDIQWNLDFRERDAELFAKAEMGEDVRRVLDLYLERLDAIRSRVRLETPVLEQALCWSEQAFD